MTDLRPAELDISAPRPSPWRNLSFVWLVPILALAVSLGVAWQSFAARGVLIEITFLNASGVTAGETTVRFRDVVVGRVERVHFADDLSQVIVAARIDRDLAPYLDADAQFWVVRPEVTTRGITGLSTVLSGVYIEGAWDAVAGTPQTRFAGLEGAPVVRPGREGRQITLRSTDGKLITAGAPVLFRGIEVGRLDQPRLTVSGDSIVVDAFIEAPHDRRLTDATRFWDTSGFSVSLGAGGLSLDVESLATLVAGGIAFDDIYEGGKPVGPGYVFDIYPDEATARRSVFVRSSGNAVRLAVAFDESVSGLAPGAPVRLGGLEVGKVEALSAELRDTGAGPDIRLIANLAIDPALIGLPRGAGREEVLDFFEEAVGRGLRARLATASLFSATLVVELAEIEDAAPAVFDRDAEPLPLLPSVESDLPDFTATAEGVLERINALPIEELLQQAIATLASVEALARAESTVALPDSARSLVEDLRAIVNDEATRSLPTELRAAVADLRQVVAELREGGAIDNLAAAVERASAAAANIATASEDFPALVEDLRALAAKANALEAEELVAAATRVLESADAVIGTEEAKALPPALTGALEEVRATLAELRAGGVVENANATMASARSAADAVAEAARGLPQLSARLEALVAQAEGLVGAYGARSDFNAETLAALREVRAAARAVSQLARAIERNPNSLILGR
ncbi:MAG: MlaD family protein [Rhodobacteraceae bacterium]|nr:MlaD family protein [Paracoccaceae bacterium]